MTESLAVDDIDGDGHPDVVVGGDDGDGRIDVVGQDENTELVGTDGPVRWWRNETATP